MLWYLVIVGAFALSLYALNRRKLNALPMVVGLWLIIFASYYVSSTYPPTPEKILLFAFVLGFGIAFLIWGVINFIIYKPRAVHIHKPLGEDGYITMQVSDHYGILYGYFVHSDEYISMFKDFINSEIWFKGFKISSWNVDFTWKGTTPYWFIMCLLEPKTIIDRILK